MRGLEPHLPGTHSKGRKSELPTQALAQTMTSRRPKSRTVFCRLCDEDYSRLANICETEGGCISDLLRAAVKDLLNRNRESMDDLVSRILTLTFDIENLSKDIEQLRSLTIANLQESHRRVAPSIARARTL